MRNLKVLGIIAMVAVIGLAMAGCKPEPADDPPPPPPPVKLAIVIGEKGPFTGSDDFRIYCVLEEEDDGSGDISEQIEFAFKLFKLNTSNNTYEEEGDWIENLDPTTNLSDPFEITATGRYVVRATNADWIDDFQNTPTEDDWSTRSAYIEIDDTNKDEIQAFFATSTSPWKSPKFNTTKRSGGNEDNITETIEISYTKFRLTNDINYGTSTNPSNGTTNGIGAGKGEGIEWTIKPYWTKIATLPTAVSGQGYTVGYKLSVTTVEEYGYNKYNSFNIYSKTESGTTTTIIRTNEGGTVVNADRGKTQLAFARTYTKQ